VAAVAEGIRVLMETLVDQVVAVVLMALLAVQETLVDTHL